MTPIQGKSLVPIFKTGEREPHEALFWEHNNAAAVRKGDWKLVRSDGGDPWELYNLASDRTELNDLALEMPDKVAELEAAWAGWAESVHVFPRRNN